MPSAGLGFFHSFWVFSFDHPFWVFSFAPFGCLFSLCPFAGLGFFVPFCGFCLFMPSAGLGGFRPLWMFFVVPSAGCFALVPSAGLVCLCPVRVLLVRCPVLVLCFCAQCGSCWFGPGRVCRCAGCCFSAGNLDFWYCPVFLLIFALCAIGRFGLLPCSRSPQGRPLCRARECRFAGGCFCFEQHDAKLKFGF